LVEGRWKHCLLALDAVPGPILCPLSLPVDATIGAALLQARRQLQAQGIEVRIDWDGAATGLWGVRRERDAVPRDGDRIEIYRPLSVDPRRRRQQRAAVARRP
jgi:putative ubiquitin-RnfH superfamily antitoxin RatB of RatAB toxin-antitoxin module